MKTAMRLVMPWIKREHMEQTEHGKCLPVVLIEQDGLPYGATHGVVQIIPNASPDEQPLVGWALPMKGDGA